MDQHEEVEAVEPNDSLSRWIRDDENCESGSSACIHRLERDTVLRIKAGNGKPAPSY